MKLYFDCSLRRCAPDAKSKFDALYEDFADNLRGAGFTVLNFQTPGLPFDPYRTEVDEFVRFADAVIAVLSDPPSVGFSESVDIACGALGKPQFLFVDHAIDLCYPPRGGTHFYQRCLFTSMAFPVRVLQNYFAQQSKV